MLAWYKLKKKEEKENELESVDSNKEISKYEITWKHVAWNLLITEQLNYSSLIFDSNLIRKQPLNYLLKRVWKCYCRTGIRVPLIVLKRNTVRN